MDKNFLIFGDSITYGASDDKGGWVGRLRELMERENKKGDFYHTVYNLGISGNNTENLLDRFEAEVKERFKEVDEEEDTIIMFAIGINDSQFVQSKQRNRVPLEKFNGNIKKLIDSTYKFTSNIIFVGLTPVDESKTTPISWNTDKAYKNEYIEKYNEAIRLICKNNNIHFIEIFDNWAKQNYQRLLLDGLHPNNEGHEKIFEIVKGFILDKKLI